MASQKRKAQNRAAQRAFRERKEKHLKDLETKVYDLEKASESANHENSVLRAQVERLQDELKDYRRKVSLSNKSPTSNRPSLDGSRSFGASGLDFDFNFDFPKFGGVPGSVMPSTQAITGSFSQPQQSTTSRGSFDDPVTNGLSSHHNSMSSKSNDRSQSASNGNQSNGGGSLFGTGFFDIMRSSNTGASPQPMNNSTNGASPTHTCSTSSHSPTSHNGNGASSSCCTSPDPVDWTNIYKFNKKPCAQYHKNGSIDGPNFTNMNTPGLTNAKTPNSDSLSFDFIANQNGGQFDPVLFGDYRDAHNAIVGDDAFTGGFFEDGVSFPDLGNDAFFNLTADTTTPARAPTTGALNQIQQQKPTHYKPTLLDQVAQQQEGNYAGVLKDKDLPVPQTEDYSSPNLMTCHKIWYVLYPLHAHLGSRQLMCCVAPVLIVFTIGTNSRTVRASNLVISMSIRSAQSCPRKPNARKRVLQCRRRPSRRRCGSSRATLSAASKTRSKKSASRRRPRRTDPALRTTPLRLRLRGALRCSWRAHDVRLRPGTTEACEMQACEEWYQAMYDTIWCSRIRCTLLKCIAANDASLSAPESNCYSKA